MKTVRLLLAVCGLVLLHTTGWCQQNDSIPATIKGKDTTQQMKVGPNTGKRDSPYKADTAARKKHDPRRATLYSTFCPGLGQIYNHKYWKLPLVYAAVGIPVYTYFDNKNWYQKCQYALAVVLNNTIANTSAAGIDSINRVDPKLKTFITNADAADLVNYRNEFRKDQDYSVIFFLLFWGLQIVDATVDAHLMNFDVSSELSMHLQPSGNTPDNPVTFNTGMAGGISGIGLVFDLHKPRFKPIPLP